MQLLSTLGITADGLKPSSQNTDLLNFWRDVSSSVLPGGSIDLFGSNIGEGSKGQNFLHQFKNMLEGFGNPISVHASSNETGGAASGGDWLLESSSDSTSGLDNASVYFNLPTLNQWDFLAQQHLVVSTPTPPLITTDSGGSSAFFVSLSSQPTESFTVSMSVINSEGVLSVNELTFSADNWNSPQEVIVKGQNEGIFNGVSTYSIVFDGVQNIDTGTYAQQKQGLTVTNVDNLSGPTDNVNLLVLPNNTPNTVTFLNGINDNTRVVVYDPSIDSLSTLETSISHALDGIKANSIGFANTGNEGFFTLLNGSVMTRSLLSQTSVREFWTSVAGNIVNGGYLDLLSCNLAASADGALLVNNLQTLLASQGFQVYVDASTTLTGNPSFGGDWIMEYGINGARDIKPVYFDSGITNWYDTFVVDRSFTVRYSTNTNGNIAFASNTSLQGSSSADNHNVTMSYIDVDSNGSTFNSSRSNLVLPSGSQVLFAGLYWAGEVSGDSLTSAPNPGQKNSVLLATQCCQLKENSCV